MPLLSQLLQEEPGLPGPPPPSSSSLSSESDDGGPPVTGLWYEGEWWSYEDYEGSSDGGMYEEGE